MSEQVENAKAAAVVIVVGVVIITGVLVGKQILEFFNITDTKEERDQKRAEENAENRGYFDPSFLTNLPLGTKFLVLKHDEAVAKAKSIYDSIGVFKDDPERIKGVFATLKTQTQVASLAAMFQTVYKKHLLSFLRDRLDTDYQKQILTEILKKLDRLPKYNSQTR